MNGADYAFLMQTLSRPRPSGSRSERETAQRLQDWLATNGIPFRLHAFNLYPYFFVWIGLWMLGMHSILALSIWMRWGWAASLFALLGIAGGLPDIALDFPLVSRPGRVTGQNILIEFTPPDPALELVISAHYDSKTELFDHFVRTFFVRNLRIGIALDLLLGLVAPLGGYLPVPWAEWMYWISAALTLPLLFLVWGLGLNLVFGRLRRVQSQGAVDNGAACAILLGLAQRLSEEPHLLGNIRLTLALFSGEEVNMQGSRAYALERDWPLPSYALNLEIMGQDGGYVFWEQDGTSLKLVPTDSNLNALIAQTVAEVTGEPAQSAGPVNSDGYSFLRVGVPATTLGTLDSVLQARGLHLPSDNLSRVHLDRLQEGEEILVRFIQRIKSNRAAQRPTIQPHPRPG